jgi:hypothetical protein
MIITISVIALLTSIAMPGLIQLFRTGADAQTYNITYAELVNARAYAIQNSVYAGVHCQAGDARPGFAETFYCAVVDKPATANGFRLAPGFMIQQFPGDMAVGQVDGYYTDASGGYIPANFLTDAQLKDFTTLTVVFSPAGNLVQTVPGAGATPTPIKFDPAADLFIKNPLWTLARANGAAGTGKQGATAVTLFEYKALSGRDPEVSGPNPGKLRADYLNQYAQALPINLYTGQVYDRK